MLRCSSVCSTLTYLLIKTTITTIRLTCSFGRKMSGALSRLRNAARSRTVKQTERWVIWRVWSSSTDWPSWASDPSSAVLSFRRLFLVEFIRYPGQATDEQAQFHEMAHLLLRSPVASRSTGLSRMVIRHISQRSQTDYDGTVAMWLFGIALKLPARIMRECLEIIAIQIHVHIEKSTSH